MTIKDLKDFLEKLPESFDSFQVVNGEFGDIDEETHYRVDKPILSLHVDEETNELCCLHQTEEEVKNIKNE